MCRYTNTSYFHPHGGVCGQGQEIVTRRPFRIFTNSFREDAREERDSDRWKMQSCRHPAKTNKSRSETRTLIFLHLLLLNYRLKIVFKQGRPPVLQRFSNVSRFAHVRGSTQEIVSETRLAAVHELRNVDRGQNRASIFESIIFGSSKSSNLFHVIL